LINGLQKTHRRTQKSPDASPTNHEKRKKSNQVENFPSRLALLVKHEVTLSSEA